MANHSTIYSTTKISHKAYRVTIMVFNATFNDISVILWRYKAFKKRNLIYLIRYVIPIKFIKYLASKI